MEKLIYPADIKAAKVFREACPPFSVLSPNTQHRVDQATVEPVGQQVVLIARLSRKLGTYWVALKDSPKYIWS